MSTWTQIVSVPGSNAHQDPYLEFALETGLSYLMPGASPSDAWVPLVLELRAGRTAEKFASAWGHNGPWLEIQPNYRNPPLGLEQTRYLTVRARRPFFRLLGQRGSRLADWISRSSLCMHVEGRVGIAIQPSVPSGAPAPGVVVTGIIDDGLAFAHEHFRAGTETRFLNLWNQDGTVPNPPNFDYGSHLRRDEIDVILRSHVHHGAVDEERVYRDPRVRYVDHARQGQQSLARRATHGAHVMDLAASLPPGVNPKLRPLIGVQLPTATTAGTSGATLARYVLDGLRFIIERADQYAKDIHSGPLPIVVNLSYGLIAGPHDGSSIIEQAMDDLIRLRSKIAPFQIVLPAGNSHLARCHARFPLPVRGANKLRWRILPDDETPSFLEIWLPKRTGARPKVEIRVRTPTGDLSPVVTEGGICAWIESNAILCKIIYLNGIAAGRDRNMILVVVAPTSTRDLKTPVAPSGVWEISLDNSGPPITIDAWIQRDDAAPGFAARGRQSYFDDPAYVRYDDAGRPVEDDAVPANASYVKRDGSVNAIATGLRTIVVGGFRRSDDRMARTSASGPGAPPPARGAPSPDGPDASAPSEDSPAMATLNAAGTRSGSVAAMNGTSAAAPLITRWLVEEIAAGRASDRTAVYAAAQKDELLPRRSPRPARKRGGGGRLRVDTRIRRGIEP